MEAITFVGLDVHKTNTSVAIAESSRGGEVRFLGEIPSTPEALHRLLPKGLTANMREQVVEKPADFGTLTRANRNNPRRDARVG
jgi:hypothetical protein